MLEQTRLILMVEAWYGQLPAVLRQLPKGGLYVLISNRFIRSGQEFRQFVASIIGIVDHRHGGSFL